jgi:hypothetical protein
MADIAVGDTATVSVYDVSLTSVGGDLDIISAPSASLFDGIYVVAEPVGVVADGTAGSERVGLRRTGGRLHVRLPRTISPSQTVVRLLSPEGTVVATLGGATRLSQSIVFNLRDLGIANGSYVCSVRAPGYAGAAVLRIAR